MVDFIKVYPNAVSEKICDALVKDWDILQVPHKEGDTEESRGIRKDIQLRNDTAIQLDHGHIRDTEEIVAAKKAHYMKMMDIVGLNTSMYIEEFQMNIPFPLELIGCQFQQYKAEERGGYYAFHYECVGGQHDTITRRALAWMVYLNDVPEGEGETEFLFQGVRLQPKKGDLVIFPAGFTHIHRGNPVYTTDKYITTGWQCWPTPEVVSELMLEMAAAARKRDAEEAAARAAIV